MASMDWNNILSKLQGQDPEQEEAQKQKADKGIANYEAKSGQKFEPEEGVKPDYSLEEAAMLATGAPAGATTGGLRAIGKYVAKKALQEGEKTAGNSLINKLKDKGAPAPRWSDVAKNEGEVEKFADFIRPKSKIAEAENSAVSTPKEVINTPRFGTNDKVKVLQDERQALNLNTPNGRDRLKEIDSLLSNRTYYKE